MRRAHVSGIHDFGPCRLAISPSGEIFVADLRNQRILRFENGSGPLVVDNTDAKPMFGSPNGVLYVVSQRGEEVQKLVGSRLEAPDSASESLPADMKFQSCSMLVTKEEVIYLGDKSLQHRILNVSTQLSPWSLLWDKSQTRPDQL